MRHRFELVGETLREMGLLLLVFVPLDAIFYQGAFRWRTIVGLVVLGIVGVAMVAVGIALEGQE